MGEPPRSDTGPPAFVSCPYCTIQIPATAELCPYCLRMVPRQPSTEFRQRLVPPDRFPALRRSWERYGKWAKIAAPVLFAGLALWAVWGLWSGLRVTVAADNAFLIETEKGKSGPNVVLRGKLTNRGEDIPDLSLRSIGVIVELRYRDGRVERRRVFPRSPYRGEGALLHGETGSFEVEIPKGVSTATLRGEIVDLGEDRQFIPAGRRTPSPAPQNRR